MDAIRAPRLIQAFNCGDVQALTALYEPGATLVIGGNEVVGRENIRKAFNNIIASRGRMTLDTRAIIGSHAGVAVLHGAWVIENAGRSETATRRLSTEVVRQQPDGTWLFVIDSPYTPAPSWS